MHKNTKVSNTKRHATVRNILKHFHIEDVNKSTVE